MVKSIVWTFAAGLALAPAGASLAQTSFGSAAGPVTGTAPGSNATTPSGGSPGQGMAQPPNPMAPPATGQTNPPSPITRNRNDCNKANCVDNGGG